MSEDGQRLCTTSADKSIKFYDVVSFDMSHMIALGYTPTRATWIHERGRKASGPSPLPDAKPLLFYLLGTNSTKFVERA